MKKILLLLCCLSWTNLGFTQEYKIKLLNESLQIDLGNTQIVEVYDNRKIKKSLGYIRKANGKDQKLVFEEGDVATVLLKWIQQASPKKTSGKTPVMITIEDFFIQESWTGSGEIGRFTCLLNFYQTQEEGKYQLLQAIPYCWDIALGNVTKYHTENIRLCLQRIINQFSEKQQEGLYKKDSPVLTLEDILHREEFSVNQLVNCNFKDGIYASYTNFIENNPLSIEVSIPAHYKGAEIFKFDDFEIQFVDSLFTAKMAGKHLKKIWGFCKGGDLYINTFFYSGHSLFVKVNSVGKYIPLIAAESLRKTTGGLIGIAAGLAGALIESIPNHKKCVYNIQTRKIYPLNRDMLLQILLEKDKVLFNEYKEQENQSKNETKMKYLNLFNKKHYCQ